MINMGQVLYEPPDVAGWEQGPGWISTGGMLARMNFAADAGEEPGDAAGRVGEAVLARRRLGPVGHASTACRRRRSGMRAYDDLRSYLLASGSWTGSDAQLKTKVPGLVHLIVGSGEYVFI